MRDLHNSDYLAGFADGEGCFTIDWRRQQPRHFHTVFRICQRADGANILFLLCEQFGGKMTFSRVTDRMKVAVPGSSPSWQWSVMSRIDVLRLIDYFNKHLLIAKMEEYKVWRAATLLYHKYSVGRSHPRNKRNPDWLVQEMLDYRSNLQALKRYNLKDVENVGNFFTDNQSQQILPHMGDV